MRMRLAILVALGALCACGEHDVADDETQPVGSSEIPRLVSAQGALAGAGVSTIDPHTMNDAEISKALGAGPFCAFRYTSAGKPVLAVKPRSNSSQAEGVVKLNGGLVTLRKSPAPDALVLAADGVHLTLTFADRERKSQRKAEDVREADMLFEIDDRLRVGYRGYYTCTT